LSLWIKILDVKNKIWAGIGIVTVIVLFVTAIWQEPPPPAPKPKVVKKNKEETPMDRMMEAMGHIYPPSINPASLPEPNGEKAALYKKFCTRCHGLFNPNMRTAEEWRDVLVDMFKRTDKLYNTMGMILFMKLPTPTERQAITDYLTSHGLKKIEQKSLPEPGSPDTILFSTVCSQCHSLPDMTLHKGAEWRDVVERMRKNMRLMQKRVISADEAVRITGYLGKHS
jgi:hypothetical protein